MESLGFQLFCYNESYKSFLPHVFADIKDFSPNPDFFATKRLQMIRAFENQKLSEPNRLSGYYYQQLLVPETPSLDGLL